VKHRPLVLGSAVLAGFAGPVATAHATTLTPNTILDGNTAGDGQCTLREAVGATRSVGTPGDCGTASGNDTIELGAATYALTIGGAGENANQMGDLDLGTGAVTSVAISGAGRARPRSTQAASAIASSSSSAPAPSPSAA
jgi:hypothetical protein